MKFYRYNTSVIEANIYNNKLTCIHSNNIGVAFYKNGFIHNTKNAADVDGKYKQFCLNAKHYGYEDKFNKQSWRKSIKLVAFL
jgi:hypothetical protein